MFGEKTSKPFAFFMFVLLFSVICTPIAFANSAEPPGLTVIVSFAPDDLSLSIRFLDGSMTNAVQLQKEKKAWETYYRFFYGMSGSTRQSLEGATLIVQSSENSFEFALPESSVSQYNNLLTLNVKNQSVTEGQSPARLCLLIAMRVILTLLIEGLIFLAFGYRNKVSWIVFFLINLITQGLLNAMLTGPQLGSYWIFLFAFFELVIFIVEMIAFAVLLKEHKKTRAVIYAFAANFASLILGGLLISYLPI